MVKGQDNSSVRADVRTPIPNFKKLLIRKMERGKKMKGPSPVTVSHSRKKKYALPGHIHTFKTFI